jgi:hypothetical protein
VLFGHGIVALKTNRILVADVLFGTQCPAKVNRNRGRHSGAAIGHGGVVTRVGALQTPNRRRALAALGTALGTNRLSQFPPQVPGKIRIRFAIILFSPCKVVAVAANTNALFPERGIHKSFIARRNIRRFFRRFLGVIAAPTPFLIRATLAKVDAVIGARRKENGICGFSVTGQTLFRITSPARGAGFVTPVTVSRIDAGIGLAHRKKVRICGFSVTGQTVIKISIHARAAGFVTPNTLSRRNPIGRVRL